MAGSREEERKLNVEPIDPKEYFKSNDEEKEAPSILGFLKKIGKGGKDPQEATFSLPSMVQDVKDKLLPNEDGFLWSVTPGAARMLFDVYASLVPKFSFEGKFELVYHGSDFLTKV